MRIGLLSDLHGNADALQAVLDDAREVGVSRLLCAGDYVGYYYEPVRCLDLLDGWDVEAVRGNHEDMLDAVEADPALPDVVRRKYGSGLDVARRDLPVERRAFLSALPPRRTLQIAGKTILLSHGAPWDPDEYLYPDAPAERFARCAEPGIDYVVLGHTHHRLVRRANGALVINPGSVGQPRDRRPGAAWAVLDTDTGACELRTKPYDMTRVIDRAKTLDPDVPFLWEVLTRC